MSKKSSSAWAETVGCLGFMAFILALVIICHGWPR